MEKTKNITYSLSFRIISTIILLLLIFSVIAGTVGYLRFTDSLTSEYNDSAFRTAETAVTLINGDKIEEYLSTEGNSDDYHNSLNRMNILCQKQNTTLIYVIAVDTSDYNHFTCVFNVVNESSQYDPWKIGFVRETTNDEYRKIYKNIYENGLQRGTVLRTTNLNGKSPHITSLVPITNSKGKVTAILCVQRPMSELTKGKQTYLNCIALSMILLSIFGCISASIFIRHQFVIPIKKIIAESERFAQENTTTDELDFAHISTIREISALGSSIEKMEHDTIQYMKNLASITAEKERIGTELELATKIQANMLPNIFPAFPDIEDFDIFASMNPAKEVGGDFYDFFLIDDDHIALVMADVSGKGIPAALFMMISKILVNNYTMMGGSPGEILTKVNNSICKNNKNDMFVTVWLGILTISSGHLIASNAGHEYPVIHKPDGSFEIFKDKHGIVVGCMEGVPYKDYELALEKGSTLFLYTDGVPEATDSNNQLFGMERMLDALNKMPDASPQQLLENVKSSVDDFVGDAPQFDDLTMLALKLF